VKHQAEAGSAPSSAVSPGAGLLKGGPTPCSSRCLGRKRSGLAARRRPLRRKLRAWESSDRDWVLESEMSVAEVGEWHLACDIEVGREAHQGGAG